MTGDNQWLFGRVVPRGDYEGGMKKLWGVMEMLPILIIGDNFTNAHVGQNLGNCML